MISLTDNILKSFWLWACLLLLLLVLIIVRIPAKYAAAAFTSATPGLALAELQGTLWSGSAGAAQITVDRELYSLGRFQWRVKPWALITMTPCAKVSFTFQSQSAKGDVCAKGQSVELSDFTISLPASLLSLWLHSDLGGDISLMIADASLEGQRIEKLNGNFSWRNGAFNDGTQWINVGSFGANLIEDQQGGANIDLVDLGGPVLADLDLNFNPTLRPRDEIGVIIKGEIGTRENAHPNLKNILDTAGGSIGEVTERGYAIEWQQ